MGALWRGGTAVVVWSRLQRGLWWPAAGGVVWRWATGLVMFLAPAALFLVVGFTMLFLRWCRQWLVARFFGVVAFVRVGDGGAAMAR
jgi:hypothetical protein